MNTHQFILFAQIADTAISKENIETAIQAILNQHYPQVIFHYNQLEANEIELIFERDLNYAIDGNLIADKDMMLLLGLPKCCFRPKKIGGTPIVNILLPFGQNYYIPALECYELYKMCTEQISGQEIKAVQINPEDHKLTVKIEFQEKEDEI